MSWDPTYIDTYGWWDASDSSTITKDGSGNVSQIDDKSGWEQHMTQVTPADQPNHGTRQINSLYVLDCDGSEYMEDSDYRWPWDYQALGVDRNDVSVFVVFKNDNTDSIYDGPWSFNAASPDVQLQSNDAGGDFDGHLAPTSGGIGNTGLAISNPPHNGPSVFCTNMFYNSNAFEHYVDGTAEGSNSGYNDQFTSTGSLKIMANRAANHPIDGAFCEMIIVHSCTTELRQLIEGYLAHKWGIEANLPGGHPYKTAAPPDHWTPSQITTNGWWDSGDESTITASGGEITAWDDKSTDHDKDLTAPVGEEPEWPGYKIAGISTIRFEGNVANDNLESGAVTTTKDVGHELYVLSYKDSDATPQKLFRFYDTGGNGDYHDSDVGGYGFYAENDAGTSDDYDPGPVSDRTHLHEFLWDGSNKYYWENGTQDDSAALSGDITINKIIFGNDAFNGDIAEVIYINGISSTATRQLIEGYLAWRYGIQYVLPGGHPYEDRPPLVSDAPSGNPYYAYRQQG